MPLVHKRLQRVKVREKTGYRVGGTEERIKADRGSRRYIIGWPSWDKNCYGILTCRASNSNVFKNNSKNMLPMLDNTIRRLWSQSFFLQLIPTLLYTWSEGIHWEETFIQCPPYHWQCSWLSWIPNMMNMLKACSCPQTQFYCHLMKALWSVWR